MTTAVVLAGGLGTRLRAEVPDLPKPMAPVAGRPFLEHLLGYWIGQGVRRFVLSTGYRHEAISAHFGAVWRGCPVEYAVEPEPLGTGGGALLASRHMAPDEPFLLLNGDTFFAVELERLRAFALEQRADWCFSLFRAREAGRYMGIDLAADGRITSLASGTGTPGRLANGGVYWVSPGAFAACGAREGVRLSLEDEIFPAALSAGRRLCGLESSGSFIDIGVPADYRRAASLLVV